MPSIHAEADHVAHSVLVISTAGPALGLCQDYRLLITNAMKADEILVVVSEHCRFFLPLFMT
jgi:hypothetical protein